MRVYPYFSFGSFKKFVDVIGEQGRCISWNIAVYFYGVSVKPVQARGSGKPHEPPFVLYKIVDHIMGKPVIYINMRKLILFRLAGQTEPYSQE
jgi:hypothetical protein